MVVVVTGHRMTGQGAALYLPLMKNCNCFLKEEPGLQRARGGRVSSSRRAPSTFRRHPARPGPALPRYGPRLLMTDPAWSASLPSTASTTTTTPLPLLLPTCLPPNPPHPPRLPSPELVQLRHVIRPREAKMAAGVC